MFRQRLQIALGSLALAALVQGAVAWWAVDVATAQVNRGRIASDVLTSFLDLSNAKQRLRTWYLQSLLQAGSTDLQLRDSLSTDMTAAMARLLALSKLAEQMDANTTASQVENVQRSESLRVLEQSVLDLQQALTTAPLPAPGGDVLGAWERMSRPFDVSQGRELRTLIAESIAREQVAVARERAAADRSLSLARGLALGATLALVVATAALALYFAQALRRPLDELRSGAEALGRGDLDHRIPTLRADEFGQLAHTVNQMAHELGQHRHREADARQRLEALVDARTAELQQALHTVQLLDARRRQLFADISHELRTPTTVIRGEAEVALRGRAKPADDYREALQRIGDASRQLGSVIDDLLTLARHDIDALAMNREPVRPNDALQRAVRQARAIGQAREVSITVDLHDDPPAQVRGDAQRLCQLFALLLDNAVRYSRPGGTVKVRATVNAAGNAWQLSVQDHGIGITPSALAQVFERRFRSDEARAHWPDGTGLGLPIAAAIVRAHAGQIDLRSEPGRGTEASLSLPTLKPVGHAAAGWRPAALEALS